MKTFNTKAFLALATSSIILFSCNNEDINPENTDNVMKINVSAPQSRVTVDNTWEVGNVVAVNYGGTVKECTIGDDCKSLNAKEGAFEWSEKEAKIEAWFTGNNTYNATLPVSFSVAADQNKDKGYEESDFLYSPAKQVTQPQDNTVTLDFYHQIAKVVINVKLEDGYNFEIPQIMMGDNNISITGDYAAPTDGNFGTWSNQKDNSTITPKALAKAADGYVKSYTALIIPQTIESGILLSGDGLKSVTCTDKTYESGKVYTYNVTVKDRVMKITSSNINDFNPEEEKNVEM